MRSFAILGLLVALAACSGTHSNARSDAPAVVASAVPCDNAGFMNVQRMHRQVYAEVTVCGTVTSVPPEAVTRTGTHKYFVIQVAPGDTIEIVDNADITGEFTVNPGDYATVHGRYYRDPNGTEGIDWTHRTEPRWRWAESGYVQIGHDGRLLN